MLDKSNICSNNSVVTVSLSTPIRILVFLWCLDNTCYYSLHHAGKTSTLSLLHCIWVIYETYIWLLQLNYIHDMQDMTLIEMLDCAPLIIIIWSVFNHKNSSGSIGTVLVFISNTLVFTSDLHKNSLFERGDTLYMNRLWPVLFTCFCLLCWPSFHYGFLDYHTYVYLFVCLHPCSVRRHTWVLMGPDLNKMLKPGFKAYISMLALWSMEIIDRNR